MGGEKSDHLKEQSENEKLYYVTRKTLILIPAKGGLQFLPSESHEEINKKRRKESKCQPFEVRLPSVSKTEKKCFKSSI